MFANPGAKNGEWGARIAAQPKITNGMSKTRGAISNGNPLGQELSPTGPKKARTFVPMAKVHKATITNVDSLTGQTPNEKSAPARCV